MLLGARSLPSEKTGHSGSDPTVPSGAATTSVLGPHEFGVDLVLRLSKGYKHWAGTSILNTSLSSLHLVFDHRVYYQLLPLDVLESGR